MSMEMGLDIWKWRFARPCRISSISVGNDFQEPRENHGMRHFQMSSMSTPTGDGVRWTSPADPGRGRARPAAARSGAFVNSHVVASRSDLGVVLRHSE
jgi:hypothetical protein